MAISILCHQEGMETILSLGKLCKAERAFSSRRRTMILQPLPAWFRVSIIPTVKVCSMEYDGLFWPVRGDVSNITQLMLFNFQLSAKLIGPSCIPSSANSQHYNIDRFSSSICKRKKNVSDLGRSCWRFILRNHLDYWSVVLLSQANDSLRLEKVALVHFSPTSWLFCSSLVLIRYHCANSIHQTGRKVRGEE